LTIERNRIGSLQGVVIAGGVPAFNETTSRLALDRHRFGNFSCGSMALPIASRLHGQARRRLTQPHRA
jgi:hypothetical protein